MISVKGMTTCTPEFHRVASKAELEAEGNAQLETVVATMDNSDNYAFASPNVWVECRREIKHHFELFDEMDVSEWA